MSYDPVNVLAEFAAKHAISFSLLSDEGSRAITELGVLDRHLEEHHATFGVQTRDDQRGVAYPVTFVLDASGRVTRKIAEENYRTRSGGALLLETLTGKRTPAGGIGAQARGDVLAADVHLDAPEYFAYQRLGLHLHLEILRGWHVYGPTVVSGAAPIAIRLEGAPPGVALGDIDWPPTEMLAQPGLDDRVAAYEGPVELYVPIHFAVNRGTGDLRFGIRIEYQACGASECLPPAVLVSRIALSEAAVPA